MVVTAFLSMWLNNTATTAMMMPIAQAVLTELDTNRKRQLGLNEAPADPIKKDSSETELCCCYTFSKLPFSVIFLLHCLGTIQ